MSGMDPDTKLLLIVCSVLALAILGFIVAIDIASVVR